MKENIHLITPFLMNTARYFLVAGVPFLIFYMFFPTAFAKNKIQDKWAKHKDFIREILYSMQTTLIIGGIVLLIIKTPLFGFTQIYLDISDYPLWWLPVSLFLAVLIHDTYFYWAHRLIHHPKLFRHVHLVHHKSTNPSPWTAYALHFTEGIIEAMVAPFILLLVPMHPLAIATFVLVALIQNVYGHLGYEIMPKWFRKSFLFEMMITSVHHNIHHAKFKGNYGYYFRIWDRLMSTEHPDYIKEYDKIQARRFGIKIQDNVSKI